MSGFVYHFTDTVRLPWIIESGELRPGTNRIGGYPRDFLWATTNESGDRTSSAFDPVALRAWRDGKLQLIRFTLAAADFADWREMVRSVPNWTANQIEGLEKAAVNLGRADTSRWCCCTEALPLMRAERVEAKSFTGGRWLEITASSGFCKQFVDPDRRGFVIGDYAYCATRYTSKSLRLTATFRESSSNGASKVGTFLHHEAAIRIATRGRFVDVDKHTAPYGSADSIAFYN